MERDVPVDVVYIDLKTDFDTVPTERLLFKLGKGGITGSLLTWM